MTVTVQSKPRRKGVFKYELLLLVASLIWGSAYAAQQIGMEKGLGPMTFNGLRFALGSLTLLPIILWRKRGVRPNTEEAKLPVKWSVAAGLALFAAAGVQQVGLQYTSSAHSGFISGFFILFVPLIGLLLGHKAPKSLWAGILICIPGLYMLSVTGDFTMSKGDWLTLICALLWSCQILVIDHVSGKGDSIRIACLEFAVCAVLSALYGLLFESCAFSQVKAALGAIAYAGFMAVGIAFTLQVVCQKRCPPGPAAVIMSLEAIFAASTGYLVLNQVLTGRAVVGCGLILCGVLVVQLAPLKGCRGSDAAWLNGQKTLPGWISP